MEIWKDIKGLEGFYQVSNKGRIKSFIGFRPRIRKSCATKQGKKGERRLSVMIQNKNYLVHRLVAIAFIPNPETLPVVYHLDGNALNPCVENLRWGTMKDKNKNDIALEKRNPSEIISRPEVRNKIYNSLSKSKKNKGINNANSKLNKKQILEIKRLFATKTMCISQISRKFDVSWTIIKKVVTNETYKDINLRKQLTEKDRKKNDVVFPSKAHGENHSKTTLTNKEVMEIRTSKEKVRDLVKKYKVARSTIWSIRAKKTWKYLN